MLSITAFVGTLAPLLAFGLDRNVDWPPFVAAFASAMGMVLAGGWLRGATGARRGPLLLVGAGIYFGFTAVSSLFIFLLFPLSNPLVDPLLLRLDAMAGYHWPALVDWLADRPSLSWFLGQVYHSSLPQLGLTILLLAALDREIALLRFMLVGIITLIIAVAIWWVAPSIGPSAFLPISEEDRIATGLYYGPELGSHLRMLVEVGPPVISPDAITGVIAFPSYHMIMALMVVWFTRGTIAFYPALMVNVAMVPATLSHGGHHLADLFGGLAVFAIGLWLARRLVPDPR